MKGWKKDERMKEEWKDERRMKEWKKDERMKEVYKDKGWNGITKFAQFFVIHKFIRIRLNGIKIGTHVEKQNKKSYVTKLCESLIYK